MIFFFLLQYNVWKTLESDPLFSKSDRTLTSDEMKRIAAMQFNRVTHYQFEPEEIYSADYNYKVRMSSVSL